MKRQTNTTGLKVRFLPVTNTKGNRIRLTQTNDKKSVTISQPDNIEMLPYIFSVLDKLEEVASYSLLVDNTQDNYYTINIDFNGNSFTNILNNF
jgi:hypothetical protein